MAVKPGGGPLSTSLRGALANHDDVFTTLFFGSLVLFGMLLPIESPDGTLAATGNALVAVSDGQIHLEGLYYTVAEGRPSGVRFAGDRRYGRGYAQALVTLPVLLVLRGASVFVDPSLVVAAGWSGGVAAFGGSLGRLVGRQRQVTAVGTAVAAGALLSNVALARPTDPDFVPMLALGVTTVVAGAAIPPIVYVLVRTVHGRAAGMAAGVAVTVASPVAYWATVPRYHTLSALFVVGVVTAFHASGGSGGIRARTLAYILAGLSTWVSPVEGGVLVAALVAVDLVSRWRRPWRRQLLVTVAFAGSLLPTATTAVLTAGTSLAPVGVLITNWSPAELLDVGQLFAVLLRSEFSRTAVSYIYVESVPLKLRGLPVTLSVLEAMPLLGALVGAVWVARERYRRGWRPTLPTGPPQTTDLLVAAYGVGLVLAYLPTLPAESSVTLRRLHPLYPLGTYLLARLEFVRAALERRSVLTNAYFGVFGVGIVAYVLLAGSLTTGPHDVARINAIASFFAAAMLGYFSVVAVVADADQTRSMAFALGGTAATTTLFVLLAALVYFPAQAYALPLARVVGQTLGVW
jgi:hypothetical protein